MTTIYFDNFSASFAEIPYTPAQRLLSQSFMQWYQLFKKSLILQEKCLS